MTMSDLPSLDDVRRQVTLYLQAHPEEAEALAPLIDQMATLAHGDDLFARSNMVGHVTSSVLVLDEELENALLIDHLHHQVRIPAGGHVEKARTLLESALREGNEETGLTTAAPHPLATPGIPFDIDSHPISARPSKGEGPHRHHDFLYLAVTPRFAPKPQENEVAAAVWEPLEVMATSSHPRVRKLIAKLRALDPNVERRLAAAETTIVHATTVRRPGLLR